MKAVKKGINNLGLLNPTYKAACLPLNQQISISRKPCLTKVSDCGIKMYLFSFGNIMCFTWQSASGAEVDQKYFKNGKWWVLNETVIYGYQVK